MSAQEAEAAPIQVPAAPAAPAESITRSGFGAGSASSIPLFRKERTLQERVALLQNAPLFSVLRSDDLWRLAEKFYSMRYREKEVIFREGEPADLMFLIESGRVKLSIASPTGQELLIAVVGRGNLFGELALIDRGPRAMTAFAMEESRVYALPGDVFWTLIENRPAFTRRLLELMARRMRRADQTSQDLVFCDAPTRLARRLLELAEEHGEPVGAGAIRIAVKLIQDEIAQMVGVSRESANRLIASFAGRGWIDWNDGRPVLLNVEALARRAR